MDELERDLRATLGNLANGPTPSDALVDTTVARSAQIRHRRRTFAASGVAAVALVAALAIASIAGAGTGGSPVRVSDPGFRPPGPEPTSTTTTTVASSTTTAVPTSTTAPRAGRKRPTSGAGVGLVTTTTAPVIACGSAQPSVDPFARSGEQYTTLANGDIEVSFGGHPYGPARETYYYDLDDGTRYYGGFAQTYSPDRFGTHWFDLSTVSAGVTECLGRVTFAVGTVGPTTSTTSTTVPTETTTTLPETTTSRPS
jgi:hypothetical protein